jgi:predicted signal transduction protein with EAL and GGDEF domain
MIKLTLLFLITSGALVVAVTLLVGVAWLAIAIPVLLVTGTGYGAMALNRRWTQSRPADKSPGYASRRPL